MQEGTEELGILEKLTNEKLRNLSSDVLGFYQDKVQVSSLDEAVAIGVNTISQCGDKWHNARNVRVTGSVAYQIYTYSSNKKPDWSRKYEGIYKSKFTGNAKTRRGVRGEVLARARYSEETKEKVIQCGLVVKTEVPWLGYSPDGIMNENGTIAKLLEFKSPDAGEKLPAKEMLATQAISSLDDDDKLKKRHPHYGQIHLGLMLLGAHECEYVNYSFVDNNLARVTVEYDKAFALKMAKTLCDTYFQELLPRMAAESMDVD